MSIITGFLLDDNVSKKLESFLDLEEKELKIYLSLLSLGSIGTLGQVSMISGYDILITNEALESLTNKGFLMHQKGTISRYYALEPFLESYIKLFEPMSYLTLIRKLSKALEESPLGLIDDSAMFNQYLKGKLDEKKKEILKTSTLSGDQFKTFNDVLNASTEIIGDTAFSIIQDMEERGKKTLQRVSKTFQNETNMIFQSITDAREAFIELFQLSRQFALSPIFKNDVLVGESTILMIFRDMVTRARKSISIFMPVPEIKTLTNLVEISQRLPLKIDIVSFFSKTPPFIMSKVKNEGIDINLRQLEELDFWGIIMDDEELLFAPNPYIRDQELTGIFTTYKPLIVAMAETFRKLTLRATPY